ncbi:MAG: response regulator [Myxococcaceae bacterium]
MGTEPQFEAGEVRRAQYTIYVNAACCAAWAVICAVAAKVLGNLRPLGLSGAAVAMIACWLIALRDLKAGRLMRGVLNYSVSGLLLLLVMGLFVPEMSVLFTFATFIFLAFGLSYASARASSAIVGLTIAVASALLFTSLVLRMSSGIDPELLRWVNVVGMAMALGIDATSFVALRKTVEARGEKLANAERRYGLLLQNAHDAISVLTGDGVILEANRGWEELLGVGRERFLGRRVEEFMAHDLPPPPPGTEREQDVAPVTAFRRPDGSVALVELRRTDVDLGGSKLVLAIGRDVTERHRLEDQLRQSQKMEAIGRFAGGIAHDFNNILSVILMNGELLRGDLSAANFSPEHIEEILKGAQRATDLTRQLLMFSRRQVLQPKVWNLNEVLESMDNMLRRIIGEDIELVMAPTPALGQVLIDRGSIEQVIMNLAVNARDAMPKGGKLTIETANVVLDDAYVASHVGAKPGPHVVLAVSDTGIGMDHATQARIFEPFFTTKDRTKGTGLGLSTVHGIVQQGGGSVWVYSEPDKGACFKVYLPRVDATAAVAAAPLVTEPATGSETVLVVDDEAAVREAACEMLRRLGYQVVEAHDPLEALQLVERGKAFQLLLTDVVMPNMSGPELAAKVKQLRPTVKVICMSGYADDGVVRHGVLEAGMAYLQKPLTSATLGAKVREVLDGK